MSDMSRETRDLIARGRAGTSMPMRRRNAIKGAVLAKVAAGTVVTTSATAAAWTTTTKVVGAAVVALAVGGGTVGVVKYQSAKAEHAKAAALATTPNRNPAELPVQNALPADPAPIAIAPQTTAGIETATPIAAPVPVPVDHSTSISTPTPTSTSTSTSTSTLGTEASLLRDAHDALTAGDPNRALALLDEHARRFPTSALEPERSAERVFAYCAEHANDAARGAASSFLTTHPTGPLADRVRSSCGGR